MWLAWSLVVGPDTKTALLLLFQKLQKDNARVDRQCDVPQTGSLVSIEVVASYVDR